MMDHLHNPFHDYIFFDKVSKYKFELLNLSNMVSQNTQFLYDNSDYIFSYFQLIFYHLLQNIYLD